MRSALSLLDLMLGFVGAIYILIALAASQHGAHSVEERNRYVIVRLELQPKPGHDLPEQFPVRCGEHCSEHYTSSKTHARLILLAVDSEFRVTDEPRNAPDPAGDAVRRTFQLGWSKYLEHATIVDASVRGESSQQGFVELDRVMKSLTEMPDMKPAALLDLLSAEVERLKSSAITVVFEDIFN